MLEPQRVRHAAGMAAVLADPRVHAFLPASPPQEAALRERFARLETRSSPDGAEAWLNWVVFARTGGPALGTVQATVRPEAAQADVAYVFAPHAWGHGYATEALAALLDFLAGGWGVREALAQVDTCNAASIRLLERLGFRRRGLTPGADVVRGSVSDGFTYQRFLEAPPSARVGP